MLDEQMLLVEVPIVPCSRCGFLRDGFCRRNPGKPEVMPDGNVQLIWGRPVGPNAGCCSGYLVDRHDDVIEPANAAGCSTATNTEESV
jgi:hypothetical protein